MSKYRVRQSELTPYSPANHTGTKNFRLIGPDTVGAKQASPGFISNLSPPTSTCASPSSR